MQISGFSLNICLVLPFHRSRVFAAPQETISFRPITDMSAVITNFTVFTTRQSLSNRRFLRRLFTFHEK